MCRRPQFGSGPRAAHLPHVHHGQWSGRPAASQRTRGQRRQSPCASAAMRARVAADPSPSVLTPYASDMASTREASVASAAAAHQAHPTHSHSYTSGTTGPAPTAADDTPRLHGPLAFLAVMLEPPAWRLRLTEACLRHQGRRRALDPEARPTRPLSAASLEAAPHAPPVAAAGRPAARRGPTRRRHQRRHIAAARLAAPHRLPREAHGHPHPTVHDDEEGRDGDMPRTWPRIWPWRRPLAARIIDPCAGPMPDDLVAVALCYPCGLVAASRNSPDVGRR